MKNGKIVLNVRNLSKSYKIPGKSGIYVFKNIDLHVNDGEFVALIGPSGCGKTTLLNCISGLTSSDSGTIVINNENITYGNHRASYMMQNDGLLDWRNVIDNVMLPLELRGVDKKNALVKARALLKQFGLIEFEEYYPKELSEGMRQRVSLARTHLACNNFILMDEPFSHLDALTKIELQTWLLKKTIGKSILFITHDIDEALFLSDRIYVLSPPAGTVLTSFSVPISRPRNFNTITTSPFISIKKKILGSLGLLQ